MALTDMNAVPQRTDAMAAGAPMNPPGNAVDVQQGDPTVNTADMQQATPEEQRAYSRFVARAMQLIYSDEANPHILEMLKGGGDQENPGEEAAPSEEQDHGTGSVDGLAQATAMVVARVAGAAEQSGTQLAPDVLYHAGIAIYEDLANLSKEAGIKDYTQDPKAFQRGFYKALDIYKGMLDSAGEIDQQSAQADMQKLQQMDQQGQLDPLFRKLAASDGGAQEGAPAGPAPAPRQGLMG